MKKHQLLRTLFNSAHHDLNAQTNTVFSILKLLDNTNQALTRFAKHKPKISDLTIGFNNFKRVQKSLTSLAIIEIAKLNSMMKNYQIMNYFEDLFDNNLPLAVQLKQLTDVLEKTINSNNQEHIINANLTKISL